jgi:excisionase family DNA binding protein
MARNADLAREGWVTKTEAAEITGLSVRTIERLATSKKIQRAWRRLPGAKPVIVIHPDDVERIRQNAAPPFVTTMAENTGPNGKGQEITVRAPRAVAPAADPASIAGIFQQLLAARPAPAVELKDKLFLRLQEAAEISGLPAAYLRQAIRDERVDAIKTGGGWRIRRSSLEKL